MWFFGSPHFLFIYFYFFFFIIDILIFTCVIKGENESNKFVHAFCCSHIWFQGSNLSLKEVIRADEQLVAGTLHFLIIKSSEDQIYKAEVYCDLRGNRFVKEINHVMIRNEGGDGDGYVAVKDDAGKDGDSRNADIQGKNDARCVNIGRCFRSFGFGFSKSMYVLLRR